MCVLYKENTRQFVVYDISAKSVTFTSSKKKASEMSEEEALALVKKCTKKLKGFQVISNSGMCEVTETDKITRRSFTAQERHDIYTRDKGKCQICGKFVPPDEFTIDHITPISRGGDYDYDNLQCCCKKCNQSKADLLETEFYDSIIEMLYRYAKKNGNKKMKKYIKKIKKQYNKKITQHSQEI